MKYLLLITFSFVFVLSNAQFNDLEPGKTTSKDISANINGQKIDIRIKTGTQALFEDKKAIASIHYTYYKKKILILRKDLC